MTLIFQNPELASVKRLLIENELPTEDLSESEMEHFFVCKLKEKTIAVIGLEILESDGLLRSLAVCASARGAGCGTALVLRLEEYARSRGIRQLYLLTNTAEDYFLNKGYARIPRESVSELVRGTREFGELCPASAAVMRKDISNRTAGK